MHGFVHGAIMDKLTITLLKRSDTNLTFYLQLKQKEHHLTLFLFQLYLCHQ